MESPRVLGKYRFAGWFLLMYLFPTVTNRMVKKYREMFTGLEGFQRFWKAVILASLHWPKNEEQRQTEVTGSITANYLINFLICRETRSVVCFSKKVVLFFPKVVYIFSSSSIYLSEWSYTVDVHTLNKKHT